MAATSYYHTGSVVLAPLVLRGWSYRSSLFPFQKFETPTPDAHGVSSWSDGRIILLMPEIWLFFGKEGAYTFPAISRGEDLIAGIK